MGQLNHTILSQVNRDRAGHYPGHRRPEVMVRIAPSCVTLGPLSTDAPVSLSGPLGQWLGHPMTLPRDGTTAQTCFASDFPCSDRSGRD